VTRSARIETPRAIAIVAGEAQTFQFLTDWLNSLGISVSTFPTAEDLVSILRRKGIHPILSVDALNPQPSRLVGAVLDMNLAGIGGLDLARAMKRWYPDLPLVVVTEPITDPIRAKQWIVGDLPPGIRRVSRQPLVLAAFKEAMSPMLVRAG
jgi:CheY-like chemotaxis protein